MFFLIPWKVDVPQDRRPVMNWLILLALVAVFALQVRDYVAYLTSQDAPVHSPGPGASPSTPTEPSAKPRLQGPSEVPGITHDLILRDWSLQGLLGHMWLHGGLFHLLGNLLFLWIFGNAVCAKIGNLRYLLLYVLFGVAGGVAHLLTSRAPMLGASGAINGIVGMYAVLFFENEITCLFAFWLVLPYVRWFTVSSIWMILVWLLFNVVGALLPGGSRVAYIAHLGGFTGGFGIALWMCQRGWITMERYERSLLQMWRERTRSPERESLETTYARVGLYLTDPEQQQETSAPASPPEPQAIPLPAAESGPASARPGANGLIRTACACGNVIRVTRQYAGRTVRCPRCRRRLVVPNQTDFFGPVPPPADAMTGVLRHAQDNCIRFVCRCGKRIRVPARYAGRTAKCPRCGIRLTIPHISA